MNKPKILAVDDDQRMLQSLEKLLLTAGYEVQTAQGGQQAISLLERERYDIALLDIIMPEVGGHQVMDFIQQRNINTMIVVVSGDTSIESAIESLRRGAYDFLRKPYTTEELFKTVENAINRRLLEKENFSLQNKLEQSEKFYRHLVQCSPDIIYILDNEGRLAFVNDRVDSLLGYAPAELIGKHYSDLVYEKDMLTTYHTLSELKANESVFSKAEIRIKYNNSVQEPRFFENSFMLVDRDLANCNIFETVDHGKIVNESDHSSVVFGVARDVTERRRAQEKINYQAYHDLLTGLPNRKLFKDRLSCAIIHSKRDQEQFTVMFLDLDRFKFVNDSLGHMIGDGLLQAVAKRLMHCLRESDTLARIGGDEFMLLAPGVSTSEDAKTIAAKVISALKLPFIVENHELFLGVSIGIVLFPEHGSTMEDLIQHADIAMYHCKAQNKGGYEFYTSHMNKTFSESLSLETSLRKALETEQFAVFYQPQIDISSGAIVGMEALIRWNHPLRGIISPAEFISLAEETGLIVSLGEWIMRTACLELKRWRDSGLTSVRLAVNLSAKQVEQPNFVEKMIEVLNEYDIPGQMIELEITESVIMKDMNSVIQKLSQLSNRGIHIAIDDFGTGYSSLSYLEQLPINTIKIDRSFLRNVKSTTHKSSVIAAIVAMAKGLERNMIAEGVETETQVEYLRTLGCREMQGFLFSKPLGAEAAMRLMLGNPFGHFSYGNY
ncbi:MAG: EAL domain-containing protein [Candidatus Competibacteraceae bacterium]|jgi:diguanylate cyclase (GGDEF)-like protein|nr:EAL domain-containing protein [Candidatus Competibacteraceae bacterium]